MDPSQTRGALIGVFLAVYMAFLFGLHVGNSSGEYRIRMEAVKAEHAKWVACPDGTVTFIWNTLPESPAK